MAVVKRQGIHRPLWVRISLLLGWLFFNHSKMCGSKFACLFQKTASSKMKECTWVFPWLIVTPGNLVVTVGHRVRVYQLVQL